MSPPPDHHHDEMIDDQHTEAMTTYTDPEDIHSEYDDFGADDSTPGRPRRVIVSRYSVGLAVILVGAACFYGGIRLEKSQVSSSGAATASGFSARFSAATGTSAKLGAARGFGVGVARGAGGFGGAAAGGGSGTEGTISTIDGDTLYVTETGGNTVKVKLSDATTLTKTVSVSARSLYPGDTVSVDGSTGSNGSVSATSVTDSGAGASTSGAAGASTGSTSTGSTGASGLKSLFGG